MATIADLFKNIWYWVQLAFILTSNDSAAVMVCFSASVLMDGNVTPEREHADISNPFPIK